MKTRSADRLGSGYRSLWLKWTLWLAVGWAVALLIADSWRIGSEGYPSWFVIEVATVLPATLLQLIVTAAISGAITMAIVLIRRGKFGSAWGSSTPLSKGVAWSLAVGVIFGFLMMYSRAHPSA